MNVGYFISVSSAFSKLCLYILKFWVHILLKPSLKAFEHNFAAMWNEHNCTVIWTFFGIALLGLEWTDLFQSRSHWWVIHICWHIECSTWTASSFRILHSSTGIPSPPLALFIVMLPKAHLTSNSRMPGSRWVAYPTVVIWIIETFSAQFFCVFSPPFLNLFCLC